MVYKLKLNARQYAFALEYGNNGGNGTQSAITVGYSPKTAHVQASRLLNNVNVQKVIAMVQKDAMDKAGISAERIVREFGKVAFTNLPGIVNAQGQVLSLEDFDNLSPEQQAAISEVSQSKDGSLRIKLHPKLSALESLAKIRGMFTEKIEHSGKVEGQVPSITFEFVKTGSDEGSEGEDNG